MKKMKDSLRWYGILTKRLLLKKSFAVILLLVPVLVGAVGLAARSGDSGMMTVALAMEDSADPIASEIVRDLVGKDSILRFVVCGSPAEAEERVSSGDADAAWIFRKGLEERIGKFIGHAHGMYAFVRVVQREDHTVLKLSHEMLNGAFYPYVSMALYSDRVGDNLPELTDGEIEAFYRSVNAEGSELFEFVYAAQGGADKVREDEETSFLVSPLRGLLAVMVVLGGMSAAMYYMQDEEQGVFLRFSKGTGFLFAVVYHAAAVVLVEVVVFAALLAAGVAVAWWLELAALAVYGASVVGFSLCLRLLLRDIRLFGGLAPVLIVAITVLCPILIPAPNLPLVQYLLPTFYYLNAISNPTVLLCAIPYTVTLYALAFCLRGER